MTDEYVPKIRQLPGVRLTPETVLHRTLDKLAHIKSVVIVIQWNDDSFDCDWSQMRVADLCMASYALQHDAHHVMNGKGEPE